MKIAALTSGRNIPSSRFRVRQHIKPLREHGIHVKEFIPAIQKYAPVPFVPETVSPKYLLPLYALWQSMKLVTRIWGVVGSWAADAVWLERQLLPGYLSLESLLKSPLVFDVDDAIWLSRPFARSAVIKTARRASVVIAGNSYLANWFEPYSRNIRIVPTAIDTGIFKPRERGAVVDSGKFVIGWTGTWANLRYLYEIEDGLEEFLRDCRDAELLIIADRPPRFRRIPPQRVTFMPWREDIEVGALQDMDVGLMPLPDAEWTRGKCGFKMLQYMAAGIAVIVSPVGMNAEVLALGRVGFPARTQQDWHDALKYLYHRRSEAKEYGKQGRSVVEKHFSRDVITPQLAKIFREIV